MNSEFSDKFYKKLCSELNIRKNLETELPYAITTGLRIAEDNTEYIFIENFMNEPREILLPFPLHDLISAKDYEGKIVLEPYAAMVCIKNNRRK